MKLDPLSGWWVAVMAAALPIVGAEGMLLWLIIITLFVELGTGPSFRRINRHQKNPIDLKRTKRIER